LNNADLWTSLARHTPLAILTDLDGTLIPFAARPEEARPDADLVALLAQAAALPGLSLAVVSGRARESLEGLFAEAPGVWLVAEHGGWLRGDGAWQAPVPAQPGALDALAAEFERIAAQYRKAWVEKKTWSIVLHARGIRPRERTGLFVQANASFVAFRGTGYELLEGEDALEVRVRRIRKSAAVPWIHERAGAGARIIALGDDLTDEDLFRELAPSDEGVQVGSDRWRATAARWRLKGPEQTIALLKWIVAARLESQTPPPPVLPDPIAPPRPVQTSRSLHRLLAVSNRLPDQRTPDVPGSSRKSNVGGLVSALEPALVSRKGLWLGWSGRVVRGDAPGPVALSEESIPPLAWMDLPEEWSQKYYNGFSNSSLWPLFHSFPGRVKFADGEWECYVKANEAFAEAASRLVDPDVPVWIHDYHLLLVAAALRRRGHRGPLGLFLHIPFPGLDLFSMIPWADRLLDGMLEHDLIGFHTKSFVENFRQCVGVLSPARLGDDAIEHRGRRIRAAAFPIGIIPEGFQEPPEPGMAEEIASLIQSIAPSRLVIGVDRLDYTKGIPNRLLAFGRMLELFPDWRGKVSLVQVSVPSRADIPDYAEQRSLVETAVGRINGEFGEAKWVPVRYLYRSYGRNQLSQLYRAADVGYVTPLRDGMNLVAKEYVAAQDPASPGVLLLSRFAGAAEELQDAVLTNPYHLDGMARDLDKALRMPPAERHERHAKLLTAVQRTTAATWAEEFLLALESCRRKA
jgi:alpha,alpha-trehalose-phosphate synthase [UDP-forming]/trehalose-phosphatase